MIIDYSRSKKPKTSLIFPIISYYNSIKHKAVARWSHCISLTWVINYFLHAARFITIYYRLLPIWASPTGHPSEIQNPSDFILFLQLSILSALSISLFNFSTFRLFNFSFDYTHILSRDLPLDSRPVCFPAAVSYTHLRAHETDSYLVCRLLLEKKKYAVFCLKKKNSFFFFFFLMIRRQPRSTHCISSAASDVYKRQVY